MGRATIELAPPRSRNATPQRSSRGAALGRHKAKKQLQADIATLLEAEHVPRPIPGDRVRATAELLFPSPRRRDEGNYRDSLEKALGDALAPHDPDAPWRWLSDDTPDHFTFGAVIFGQTPLSEWRSVDGHLVRRRRPAVAIVTLAWGEDLAEQLELEARALRRQLATRKEPA